MQNKTRIFTVTQVNTLIKTALENTLPPRLAVIGEITDWHRHQSGHCYFSLKDPNSLLPCVMWSSSFRKLKFKIENGLAVIAKGHIDLYIPGGKYQLYVDSVQPEGIGALQLAFEQMFARLQAQGLFDDAHKKPLPSYPRRIAVLTSESGAAIHDITDSILSRWPPAQLFLYPVPVQGEGAAEKIAARLRDINSRNEQLKLDLVILGRGGGSIEDLWAFNEEVLARAIYDSDIPVISAVGHEVDTTITDLVADARASTPTKAGVAAVPDIHEVLDHLNAVQARLTDDIKAKIKLAGRNLQTILASAVFKTPLLPVLNKAQQLDEAAVSLSRTITQLLTEAKETLHIALRNIIKIEPHRLLAARTIDLNNLQNSARSAVKAVLENRRLRLTAAENRLSALNPKSVLKRGYTITKNKRTGRLVKRLADIKIADYLITELQDKNFIESKVTKKQNKADKS